MGHLQIFTLPMHVTMRVVGQLFPYLNFQSFIQGVVECTLNEFCWLLWNLNSWFRIVVFEGDQKILSGKKIY